jgi:hypothetical protein
MSQPKNGLSTVETSNFSNANKNQEFHFLDNSKANFVYFEGHYS